MNNVEISKIVLHETLPKNLSVLFPQYSRANKGKNTQSKFAIKLVTSTKSHPPRCVLDANNKTISFLFELLYKNVIFGNLGSRVA